jgi:chromosome segregation ATPase
MTPEKQKIVDQIKQTFEKAKQLEQSGKHDEAEKLRQEARALYAKLNPSTGPATAPTGPSPERQKLYEQYKALHEKIEAAKKAGNSDEVHHLMQEMDALHAKLRSQEGSPARNYSTNGGDRAARMQHLRSAAENLKAAGCDAEAQHVIDLIRHMEAEGNGSSSRYAPQGRTAPSTSNPAYTPGPRSADGASQAAVQELRGQVEQMHREMRELREELNRAKSGDHR